MFDFLYWFYSLKAMNDSAIKRGKTVGFYYLVVLLPLSIISGFATSIFPENTLLSLSNNFVFIVMTVAYFLFLWGVVVLGKNEGDETFVHHMKIFIWVSVGLMIVPFILGFFLGLFAPSFSEDPSSHPLFLVLTLVAAIVALAAIGVISLYLAKDFERMERSLGEDAREASKWFRISGYLTLSVILSPIAAFLSIFADYYMWKLLRERVKKSQLS